MISIGMLINVSGLLLSITLSMLGFGSEWTFFGTMTLVGLGNGISLPNANAGLLSINPKLAGTASGLGGSIMIGLGSILSAMAGILLDGSKTEIPLISLMLISAFLGLLCTFYVIKRNKELRI
jgi:DHA1 family bicyclomycin/chloramphenicol resistance-like MFS transporter